jgi:hypothetical protein
VRDLLFLLTQNHAGQQGSSSGTSPEIISPVPSQSGHVLPSAHFPKPAQVGHFLVFSTDMLA